MEADKISLVLENISSGFARRSLPVGSEPGFAPRFSASHRSPSANRNRPWRWGSSAHRVSAKIKPSPLDSVLFLVETRDND